MRILVYEHSLATAGPDLAAFRAEGRAMLQAVMADLASVPGTRPWTILAVDVPAPGPWPVRWADPGRTPLALEEETRLANGVLVIAPESDGILADCCARVESVGGRLLGPAVTAIALTADKLRLADHWLGHGVPTPATRLLAADGPVTFPAVSKPRHGAGSESVQRIDTRKDLSMLAGDDDGLIVQPLVPGMAASVAWLIGENEQVPLLPAGQDLSDDGRFRYRGGWLPLPASLAERAVAISRRAVEVVPGLRGYVGVDVVLGPIDQAIELNPRLTTSYVGLRVLAEDNLAAAMLRAALGGPIKPLHWSPGQVRFTAEGVTERMG